MYHLPKTEGRLVVNEKLFLRIPPFLLKKSLLDAPTDLEKSEEKIKKYALAINEIVNYFKETSLNIIRRKKILKTELIEQQTKKYNLRLKGTEISNLFDEMVCEKKVKYIKNEFLQAM